MQLYADERTGIFIDHYLIFSSDGDYTKLIKTLKNKGKRTTTLSTTFAQQCIVPDSLRRSADQFVELSTSLPFISQHLKQAI